MALSELLNSDTLKQTIIPVLIVLVALFFWFKHNGSNRWIKKRKRSHGRAPNSRHDNLEYSRGADGEGEVYLGRRQELDDIGDEVFARDQEDLNITPYEAYDESEASEGKVQMNWDAPVDVEDVPLRNEDSEFLFQPESEFVDTASQPEAPASPSRQKESQNVSDSRDTVQVDNKNRGTKALEEELKEGLMIALNIIAGNGRQLRGSSILKAITSQGFTYGPMSIFHYYSSQRSGKRAVFSLANMMEPGSFNLTTMDTLSTPGLTLFTNIISPDEGMETFSVMLGTAKKLAESLDATVCDERRGTLSKQGIDHIQERILEHQRRSKLLNTPPPPLHE
ncbi:MAG: cell division protein ZipA [Gammaproteobacteria bacterium]|nr:cell division protein ZipA [Gammaproteobacteria bacterium]